MKLVVFDMDETIGAFTALSKEMLELTQYRMHNYAMFKHLLELNPFFVRPGMLHILHMMVACRKLMKDVKLVLYTNNPSAPWIQFVVEYLESQVRHKPLFCKIIDGNRPSLDKCVADVLKATKAPKKSRIFFIDDQMHRNMVSTQVFYYQIPIYSVPDHSDRACVKLQKYLVKFLNLE